MGQHVGVLLELVLMLTKDQHESQVSVFPPGRAIARKSASVWSVLRSVLSPG